MKNGNSHVLEVGGEGPLLVIHGGAGRRLHEMSPEQRAETDAALARAVDAGYGLLSEGASALEAVVAAVHVMEDEPCFNAGRGAALTLDGRAEMDSCVMLGDGSSGAACGLTTARHPVDVARAVMERTPHVLFSSPSKERLEEWGIEQVDPSYFVTERREAQLAEFKELEAARQTSAEAQARAQAAEDARHGTVGAVARDAAGRIAAATSTGGITGQQPGRVGDSPICGAGTYADQRTVAVSCTGTGEKFIQEVAAHQVSARVAFGGQGLADAAGAMLDAVDGRGGNGGVIAVPAAGAGAIGFTDGAQMNYAWAWCDERVTHE